MKMPPGNFIHFLLKTIGQEPLQQTEASCLQLGKAVGTMDQIHLIHLLPQGEQQKGAKAAAATRKGGGHGQRTSQDFF